MACLAICPRIGLMTGDYRLKTILAIAEIAATLAKNCVFSPPSFTADRVTVFREEVGKGQETVLHKYERD